MWFAKVRRLLSVAFMVIGVLYTGSKALPWAIERFSAVDDGSFVSNSVSSPDNSYIAEVVFINGGGISPFCVLKVLVRPKHVVIITAREQEAYSVYAVECSGLHGGGRGDGPSVYWLDKYRLAVEFAQGYAPKKGRDTYLKSSDLSGQVTVGFTFK